MAKIKIQRSSEYNNKMRSIQLLVDGKQIGVIGDGETKEFTVKEGQRILKAKIDWCSSPEVLSNVDSAEVKHFKIESFAQRSQLNKLLNSVYLVLIIVVLHFILAKTMDFYYMAILLLPPFIFMLYYLTMARKKYLTLKEIDDGIR